MAKSYSQHAGTDFLTLLHTGGNHCRNVQTQTIEGYPVYSAFIKPQEKPHEFDALHALQPWMKTMLPKPATLYSPNDALVFGYNCNAHGWKVFFPTDMQREEVRVVAVPQAMFEDNMEEWSEHFDHRLSEMLYHQNAIFASDVRYWMFAFSKSEIPTLEQLSTILNRPY